MFWFWLCPWRDREVIHLSVEGLLVGCTLCLYELLALFGWTSWTTILKNFCPLDFGLQLVRQLFWYIIWEYIHLYNNFFIFWVWHPRNFAVWLSPHFTHVGHMQLLNWWGFVNSHTFWYKVAKIISVIEPLAEGALW